MLHTYSIVIQPPADVIENVKSMKDQLFKEIGWYNSRNSWAHITLNEFEFPSNEIEKIKSHLTKLVVHLSSQNVHFNHFDSFPNGAFFLAPESESKDYLKMIMRAFHQDFNFKTAIKSNEPHISIGRRISDENLKKAFTIYPVHPEIHFNCDRIALRVFNTDRKQFDIVEEFIFGNNPKNQGQMQLF